MLKVIGAGDNVVDFYLDANTIYPGGNALNFAVYAHLLGIDSAYLGVFGDDRSAQHVYHTLRQMNIPIEHCRFYHGEGGIAHVSLSEGDRCFLGSNLGGVAKEHPLCFSDLDIAYLKQFTLMHTSIFSYVDSQLPKLHTAGIRISYDFSNRFDQAILKKNCPYIWCACLSSSERDEEENLALMREILSYGCSMVLLTSGVRGAMLLTGDALYRQAPNLVDAVDTMGAGDSFITAFLTSYLSQGERPEHIPNSLHRAAVFSSENCMRSGSFGYGARWDKTTQTKN